MTQPTNTHGIRVSVRPGGLSSGAHAVHILITLCTGGLWIVPYLLIVMAQPVRTVTGVIAPPGTPADVVEHARRSAMLPSIDERKSVNRRNLALGIVMALIVVPPVWLFVAAAQATGH